MLGHPIGPIGLAYGYRSTTSLLGRAGERQLPNVSLGLTHNLGVVPYLGVAAVLPSIGLSLRNLGMLPRTLFSEEHELFFAAMCPGFARRRDRPFHRKGK